MFKNLKNLSILNLFLSCFRIFYLGTRFDWFFHCLADDLFAAVNSKLCCCMAICGCLFAALLRSRPSIGCRAAVLMGDQQAVALATRTSSPLLSSELVLEECLHSNCRRWAKTPGYASAQDP